MARSIFIEGIRRIRIRALWKTLILLAFMACAAAQTIQSPPFHDRAAIPAFRKEDPRLRYFTTILRSRVDEVFDLLLIRASPTSGDYVPSHGGFYCGKGDWLGLFIEERAHPERLFLLTLQQPSEIGLKVLRSSSSELVLARYGDKEVHELNWKLFFDPRAKSFIREIEYPPFRILHAFLDKNDPCFIASDLRQLLVVRSSSGPDRLRIMDQKSASRILSGFPVYEGTDEAGGKSTTLDKERMHQLHFGPDGQFTLQRIGSPDSMSWRRIEEATQGKPRYYTLPQSTYAEFGKARPGRVRDGYSRNGTTIAEGIGPTQLVENRLWFGKEFYDSEGITGIGGLGYFDMDSKKYTLFSPPEIRDWSATAILVEPECVWLGLAHGGEWGASPGGLMRWDRSTGKAEIVTIDSPINGILRYGDELWLATNDDIAILKGTAIERYMIDKSIRGGYTPAKR